MTPGIIARVLGRAYMRNVEYLSQLKQIVRATGWRSVPAEYRKIVKEQAAELTSLEENKNEF